MQWYRFIAVDDTDIDATNKKAVSRLQANGDMSFIMLMKDFTFDMDKMQEHFNEEYVESDKFPRAFFNGKITNFSSVNFKKDGTVPNYCNRQYAGSWCQQDHANQWGDRHQRRQACGIC